MEALITVTIPGGTYYGPDEDSQMKINPKNIISVIDEIDEDNLSKSIITMSDGSKIFAKETSKEIEGMIMK